MGFRERTALIVLEARRPLDGLDSMYIDYIDLLSE